MPLYQREEPLSEANDGKTHPAAAAPAAATNDLLDIGMNIPP
jgi:hypothetical protein